LIGPNGSGKTTLINCISGALRNDGGSIVFDGEEVSALPAYQRTRRGIARSFQIPRPFTSMSVLENLVVPLEYVRHRGTLHIADTRAEALEILRTVGLQDKAQTQSNRLTQVELRKLELARAMAARPRLPDLGREHGGTFGQRGGGGARDPAHAQRIRDHDHHDRAHHAGRDAVLAARRVPRRGTDHLRGNARRESCRTRKCREAYLGA
jgi:hypothetical protein